MKIIISLLLSAMLAANGVNNTKDYKTLVTEINEDDQIKVLVKFGDEVKSRQIHGYDFNVPIRLAEEIPTKAVAGNFTSEFIDVKGQNYYQFKSYDNSVWWSLTEVEIGFKPKFDKRYVLLYCDNDTTSENKPCDCLTEWDCECELYDDVLLGIFEGGEINDNNKHQY